MKYCVWLFVMCSPALAMQCPSSQAKDTNALVEIEKTWAAALDHSDSALLGCILANEFEDAGPDGALTDREATLANAAKPRKVHHELTDLHSHLQDNYGYIRGLATATDPQGKPVVQVRFTDIYVYRDGRWQCVAGHESMLSSTKR